MKRHHVVTVSQTERNSNIPAARRMLTEKLKPSSCIEPTTTAHKEEQPQWILSFSAKPVRREVQGSGEL